ncbi:hypothetical protein ACFY19_31500 [Streptosporangium saharense]|uniref:DUF4190 domain-containing protein n=1 Tax=Streptosporangium saharense TaxID=1706840 RepID=A0A7W7VPT1_9ACTN|nr:DUF4190 domain-containing protein [Streptosporangium saharense]MBB4917610.1 hypothetical protein [Streptosporangium saharense]
MSSGPPEGPSANPDDWKSPYSTGPGQNPGYGTPSYDQGYGLQHTQPSQGSGQNYNQQQPSYDQSYGQGYGQGYGQPAYPVTPGYGESPYGQYPPSYGPGPYPGPQQHVDGTRTHAIVALVVSIFLAITCYVSLGGLAGVILSAVALSKVERDPHGAKNLLKWTWISIGINVALVVLGVGGIIIAGVNGAFD